MRTLNNLVVISPDKVNNKVGDIEIDTTWNDQWHSPRSGVVVTLPELRFSPKAQGPYAMDVEVDMELEIGDRVWFHYSAYLNAKEEGFMVDDNIVVRYDQIYMAERGDEKIAIAGHVLYAPIPAVTSSIIELPTKEYKKNTFKVVLAGSKVKRYKSGILNEGKPGAQVKSDDGIDIKEGDVIYTMDDMDVKIEYDLHKKLFPENDEIYRGRRAEILAVIG